MTQITEGRYNKLRERLLAVTASLEGAMKAQEEAANFGDLSENEEYHAARQEAEQLAQEKMRIELELSGAEIVQEDRSPRITLGSVVEVTKIEKDGTPISDTRVFTIETHGDTVGQMTLGVESPLGTAILNGMSGVYKVPNNGGTYYSVRKVLE